MRRVFATVVLSVVALVAVLSYRSPQLTLNGVEPLSVPSTSHPPSRPVATTTAPAPASTSTQIATTTLVRSPTTSSTPKVTTTLARISYFAGPSVKAVQPGDGWVFGVVRVEIAIRDGQLINVVVTALPPTGDTGGPGTRPTTTSISNYVAPILRSEALRSQGIKVATVSGATYTCDAFRQSLQAALRDAGL